MKLNLSAWMGRQCLQHEQPAAADSVTMAAEFGAKAATVISQYRHFILDLYHARPIEGYTWLHGVKDGRMVHVRFFELAALSVDVAQKGREVTLKLADFTVPPDDVPEDVQRAISHWSQWIDYWAVDWHNHGDTFHNLWQAYRTRQNKSQQLQVAHKYAEPGDYTIMI